MPVAEDKALVRRFAEHTGRKQVDEAANLLAPDFVYRPQGFPDLHGPREWAALNAVFLAQSPNLRFTLDVEVAEEFTAPTRHTWVAHRFTWHTVHEREFMGLHPTGKSLSVVSMAFYRVANGKIVEMQVGDDYLGLMRQLGAIPLSWLQDKMVVPGVGGASRAVPTGAGV